jgi:hypothetical protein
MMSRGPGGGGIGSEGAGGLGQVPGSRIGAVVVPA